MLTITAYIDLHSPDYILMSKFFLPAIPRRGDQIVDKSCNIHSIENVRYTFDGLVLVHCDGSKSRGPWNDKGKEENFETDLKEFADMGGWTVGYLDYDKDMRATGVAMQFAKETKKNLFVMEEPKDLISCSVAKLEINPRLEDALIRSRIFTIGDLIQFSASRLHLLEGVGPQSVRRLRVKLGALGLAFAPREKPAVNKL